MSEAFFEGPEWAAYAKRVRDELIPMVRESSVTISLVPEGEIDAKFAIELGVCIMLDKPIIAVVQTGTKVPSKLALVADIIVEKSGDGDPTFRPRFLTALRQLGIEPSGDS